MRSSRIRSNLRNIFKNIKFNHFILVFLNKKWLHKLDFLNKSAKFKNKQMTSWWEKIADIKNRLHEEEDRSGKCLKVMGICSVKLSFPLGCDPQNGDGSKKEAKVKREISVPHCFWLSSLRKNKKKSFRKHGNAMPLCHLFRWIFGLFFPNVSAIIEWTFNATG